MSDTLAELMAAARAIDAEAAASQPAAQQPAQQPAATNPPAGQGESLEALEARLRGLHADHVREVTMEAQREANEELMKQVMRRDYVPPPKPAATATPRTRRDGSMLTAYDLKLAAEMQREFPRVDFTGNRIPPNYWR